MEIKCIIYITEKNVDGCGSDASDLYGIDHPMTTEEKSQLAAALAEVKETCGDECLSTGDMVEQAMDAVFGAGQWKVVPYTEVFF